jgi:hypothetical protein
MARRKQKQNEDKETQEKITHTQKGQRRKDILQ